MRILNLILFVFSFFSSSFATIKKVNTDAIDWEKFLSQHDLVWDSIPENYYAGAILGNGLIGVNIFAEKKNEVYKWAIGRVDVSESREGTNILFDKARLPIGYFSLTPSNKIENESMRLSLWNADVSGKLKTSHGEINFNTLVLADENIIEVNLKSDKPGLKWEWKWTPGEAISPRVYNHPAGSPVPEDYMNNPNPPVKIFKKGNINYSLQKLVTGNAYVTAWTIQNLPNRANKLEQRILITVSNMPTPKEAIDEAKKTLENYSSDAAISEGHRKHADWWHDYYKQSFASFPDAKLESFYWIQQYKLACLTRKDKYVIDLQGPWTNDTPWPATWWNLNIQLTYSPLFTANRSELSEPLWKSLNDNIINLENNIQEEELKGKAITIGRTSSLDLISPQRNDLVLQNQYEVGNLTWVLYYYYLYCMYNGDYEELTTRFYPLLKKSIAYYEYLLKEEEDGKLHLPMTASPEYKPAEDCNYDLALLRWGLNTLLEMNEDYELGDKDAERWEKTLAQLADFPTDDDGYLIGRNVKLESSHRHFSHLMMIYPLQLVNWDNDENKDLITKSMNHWLGLKGALQGYTFTAAASMYGLQENGDKAYQNIKTLLDRYIQPNTLYRETGPVIETPLAAATSIQELYLSSRKGEIKVFPALPKDWNDISFVNFKAYGGILVSATYGKGHTDWVQLEATGDKKTSFILHTSIEDDIDNDILVLGNAEIVPISEGIFKVQMNKGSIIEILQDRELPMPVLCRNHNKKEINQYGIKKKSNN